LSRTISFKDGRIIYAVPSELLKPYQKMPREFKANMKKYFGEMNAQGLETIGLFDGDGWEKAPAKHDPDIKRDTSYSVFYDKNLAPEELTWVEWVDANIPVAAP